MPKAGKKVDPNILEQQMGLYSEETVGTFLDQTFNATDDPECGHQAERGDHIIIDGKTCYELAVEEFRKTPKGKNNANFREDFKTFYKNNGKRIVNEQVAAALKDGRRVEVFVPDPRTGKIKKEPACLTRTGYDMNSPLLKPRQLSRWKRFWSKLGFYKNEARTYKTEQESYRRTMEARERVQFYNKATRAVSSNLMGELTDIVKCWKDRYPNRENVNLGDQYKPYRLARQAFASFTNIVLARQKGADGKPLYSNEELFDMDNPKMVEARANAAEEVYQHALKNDGEWLATLLHDSKTVLTERINEQGKKVNFAHPDLTEQKSYQVLNMLSLTSFDVSQEISQVTEELEKQYGKDEYSDLARTMGDLPNVLTFIGKSMNAQKDLATGVAGDNESCNVTCVIGDVMAGQVIKQHFADMQKKPNIPFQDYYEGTTTNVLSNISGTAALEDYEIRSLQNWKTKEQPLTKQANKLEIPPLTEQARMLKEEYFEDHETFAKQIASGVMQQRVKLQGISTDSNKKPYEAVTTELSSPETAEKELKSIRANEQREAQKNPNAQVLA